MASIRKRGETYHITVSLGLDADYKQVRKFTTFEPPHGLTEKQGLKTAQEYARVFELNCRGLTSFDENMTLSVLCDWYFKNIAPQRLRQRTLENFQNRLDLYVLRKLGQKKLRELKPAILAAHFAELQKSGSVQTMYCTRGDFDLKAVIAAHGSTYRELERHGVSSKSTTSHIANGGATLKATCQRICEYLGVDMEASFTVLSENMPLTANTVRGTQANLSAVFSAAVKAEIITQNPLGNVDLPQIGEIDRPVLTPEQAKLFLSRLASVEYISVRALLVTELFTGARTGELWALLWSDVNFDSSMLSICKSGYNKCRVTLPKTKSSVRILKVDTPLLGFLNQYKDAQSVEVSAAGSRWMENGLVYSLRL